MRHWFGGVFTFLLLNAINSLLISKPYFQEVFPEVKNSHIPKIFDPLFWAKRITLPTSISLMFIGMLMAFQISLHLEICKKKIGKLPLPQVPKLDELDDGTWWLLGRTVRAGRKHKFN